MEIPDLRCEFLLFKIRIKLFPTFFTPNTCWTIQMRNKLNTTQLRRKYSCCSDGDVHM